MTQAKENFVLPHSLEAEKALLGSILREPGDKLNELLSQANLKPDYFFSESHRKIFSVILELDEGSRSFDVIIISEKLRKLGFEHPSYVIDLMNDAPLTTNISYYADEIRKNFFLRKVIITCQETAKKAMSVDGEVNSFIEMVEKEFLTISKEQEVSGGLVSVKDALVPTLEEIEKRITSQGETTGVTTGFMQLDNFTGGWQKSDLIILAARPGMGKTALALNWALNSVKLIKNHFTAIFTLEMSKEQLLERLISAEGKVDSSKLRKGDLDSDEQDRLMHAARSLHALEDRLAIDETPGITLLEIRSRCRRYKKEKGLGLIIIDYLQLMSGSAAAQKQSREREISEISMGLKSLAKELSVPVIALAQLNRGPDARPDKRPRISDLRESGSMEQDADQIMFVYRDEYYNPQSEHAGKAEVLVAKNRHGETGSFFLAWQPNYVSFYNLMQESEPDGYA